IIDRKEDYSIVPVDVYEVLNGFEKLKAIAIVIYKETSAPNVAIEEYLFNGRMKLFSDVEEAEAWLRTVVEPS
ncbi:MAG: hypothetical protein GWO08_17490, partial [Gammaproteobacteria bacterium]|nr:hypothetical protein [Gammaproteobacteria bacterium]NIR95372.1 hypothetical protein [Gammaproteobacteria bacterium]NIX59585.1 hypothetical protein [candidate division Zixibacteria bacterium]